MNNAGVGREPDVGFVGEYRQEATPVPIPNTEVKLLPPMILLSGKVGYRRLYDQPWVNARGCSFFGAMPVQDPLNRCLISSWPAQRAIRSYGRFPREPDPTLSDA